MSLEEQFSQAQERVNKLSRRPSDLQLLELYSLYKQAIMGDVTGKRPGAFDFKGRAKWEHGNNVRVYPARKPCASMSTLLGVSKASPPDAGWVVSIGGDILRVS